MGISLGLGVLWYAEEMLCKSMVSKCVVTGGKAKRGEARAAGLGGGLVTTTKWSQDLQAADWIITQ